MASGFGFPFGGQSDYDEERTRRTQHIKSLWGSVRSGQIPRVPRERLLALVNDLKEEGNALFKEKDYRRAGEHYSMGITVAEILADHHYIQVNPELYSSLFSNRAFCCLKMDIFDLAAVDCDRALQLNKDNIKAYYRKALAYKSKKEYELALEAAEKGKKKAEDLNNKPDVSLFQGLICEVCSHLPANHLSDSHTEGQVAPFSSLGLSKLGGQAPPSPHSGLEDISFQSSRLSQYKSRSSNDILPSDLEETSSSNKNNYEVKNAEASVLRAGGAADFDEDWLQGTNVHVSKKAAKKPGQADKHDKLKTKKSVKQTNVKQKTRQRRMSSSEEADDMSDMTDNELTYSQKSSARQKMTDTETSDACSADSIDYMVGDWQPAKTSVKQQQMKVTGYGQKKMGLDDFSVPYPVAQDRRLVSPPEIPIAQRNIPAVPLNMTVKNDTTRVPYSAISNVLPINSGEFQQGQMALPMNIPTQHHQKVAAPLLSPPAQILSANHHRNVGVAPDLLSPHEVVAQSVTVEPDNLLLMQIRGRPIVYPFNHKLDHKLVCSSCFVRISNGRNGYQLLHSLSHECMRNILLVREKRDPQANWVMIRSRNMNVNFQGEYQLCRHFMSNQPCRVAVERCSFVHSEEEKLLWELDRSHQLDLQQFITEEARILRAAIARLTEKGAGAPKVKRAVGKLNNEFSQYQPVMDQVNVSAAYSSSLSSTQNQVTYNSVASRMPPQHVQPAPPAEKVPLITHPPQLPAGQMAPFLTGTSGFIAKPPMIEPPSIQSGARYSATATTNTQNAANQFQSNRIENAEVRAFLQDHNHKLACSTCVRNTPNLGVYMAKHVPHECGENILLMQVKGHQAWVRVRQRRGSHRQFSGMYKLCYHFCAEIPRLCTVGEENCVFAHNTIEQFVWTLEKDGKFSIQEFILKNRSGGGMKRISITEILKNYGGAFHFICKECFYRSSIISVENPVNKNVCSAEHHIWQSSKLLINMGPKGITTIEKRPFTHKEAFFLLCHKLQFCMRRMTSFCAFAHSFLERDVWILEREEDISREDIVKASQEFHSSLQQPSPPPTENQAGASPTKTPTELQEGSSVAVPVKCPFKVMFVCGLCWKQGLRNGKEPNKDRCVGKGSGHQWQQNRICLLLTQSRAYIIRTLPQRIPTGNRFRMCTHIQQKRKCDYAGSRCQFAHSEEEIRVWTWQIQNNERTLDGLVALSQKTHAPASATIAKGQSVVAAKPVVAKPRPVASTPWELAVNAHYCHYCGIQCNSQKQWEGHCASDKHMFNVNSDKEHQWNFRQPPWGVPNGNYELCQQHLQGGRCQFSNKPDMYNYCKFAHSRDELDEWKERWDWRSMKRNMAREEKMYSYMDGVLEEYQQAESGFTVMAEDLDEVKVESMTPLTLCRKEKACVQQWLFTVTPLAGQKLHRVALLHNKDRLHFNIKHDDLDKTCQLAPGDVFCSAQSGNDMYAVEIQFSGGMFGSFMQWVIFDFGSRPLLVQKLNVEVTNEYVQQKVKQLREHLHFDRWNSDNREIIKFQAEGEVLKTFNSEMLLKYKSPSSATAVITHDSVGVDLNRHNYVHKMHKLLEIEEITRHRIISSYNLKTDIEVIDTIKEESYIFARKGELFARVPLNDQLSEDTDAGKLILTSVHYVLIADVNGSNKKVYEAILVQKENFDYDGRGLNYIYLCLSPKMCREMGLRNGDHISVEIQFQMDRLPFCLMHYTLEQLKNNDVVFPDVTKITLWNEKHTLRISSSVLNKDQMKIVQHIVAERVGYTPPLIIYGPFGTGKTETLAQATMVLVKERPDARVLICTHSNSAADLYIIKHFDQFIKRGHAEMKVRRVYYEERRVTTVQPVVQQYCQVSADHSCFLPCSAEDIRRHQVVITTLSTSLVFSRQGLEGYFTHIFIDEGGQALECEAIMPFSLANDSTCIVLAGDHMQMSPKIYSSEGRQQRFHQSLLERLFHYYDAYASHIHTSNLNILLSINYRSKMEIVRFISAIFYGGPDKLLANSNDVNVEGIKPLTFYTAQGREVQDADSTSYYNIAEIEEVTDRVAELFNNWPAEWGECNPSQIGVVTAYFDQVWKIRSSLRKRRKELRDVVVERVMNMQGREFRALFISTVRTRHVAENPPRLPSDVSECDGDVGDFGFLSDQKLLNTALTRAQSLVAVIGDPVALCSVGECANIWRTLLKHCQNMGSIFPSTVTLDSIKAQVVALMSSPHGQNLIKLAALGQDAAMQKQAANQDTPAAGQNEAVSPSKKLLEDMDSARSKFIDEWDMDYQIEPDEILQQLAREAMRNSRTAQKASDDGKEAVNGKDAIKNDEPLKIECIKVKEEEGHAVVYYNPNLSEEARKRHLMGADNYDAEFDSESDMTDEEDDGDSLRKHRKAYVSYTNNQLLGFLRDEPDKYHRCILHVESSRKMYAVNTDRTCPVKQINICSRLRCGRGFNNDEVVVEVVQPGEDDLPCQPESEQQKVQGQVVGILKRAINPKYRTFVCFVEQGNTGMMVPLNRGIPKLYNLETKQRMTKTKKGHVCVYTFTKDREIIFHHYEPVNPQNQMAKLFLVRYLKWEAKFYSPLGIVVGVLPAGDSVEHGMKVLEIEHSIPKKFKENVSKQVKQLYHVGYTLPSAAYANRLDCRDRLVFTIDPPGSQDLDDALCIEELADGNHLISIHIADVAYFIKRDSSLDAEAFSRGTSFYPVGGDVVPMIPNRLSTDLCSLQPQQDRLVVSIMMIINRVGTITDIRLKRCVINSKFKLHYTDVEGVLQGKSDSELPVKLQVNLRLLYGIAQQWRQERLGSASLYQPLEEDCKDSPKSHLLVEEMMICANQQVAQLLLNHFPKCTPLRHQLPPEEIKLDEWRTNQEEIARNSPALTRAFLYPGTVCSCQGLCMCIPSIKFTNVQVRVDVWEQVCKAAKDRNLDLLTQLLIGPEHHPQLAMALLQLYAIQERSIYVCSGDVSPDDHWHYSLNIKPYTHFTSPIRRYLDVIVHRLLVAVLDGQPCPYSQVDMSAICVQCTDTALKAKCYENATQALHLSAALRENPLALYPVVQSVDDSSLSLRFPTVRGITPSSGNITLKLLQPSDRPVTSGSGLDVMWLKRIYYAGTSNISQSKAVKINNKKYVVEVPAMHWQLLLQCLKEKNMDDIQIHLEEIKPEVSLDGAFSDTVFDVNRDKVMAEHFSEVRLHLEPSNIVKVQVVSDMFKGLLSPRVQLLNLTASVDVCLEHQANPVQCFANTTTIKGTRSNYKNIETYVQSWLPLLAMEAAHCAASNDESAVIHNVSIKWQEEVTRSGAAYIGTFALPIRFCKERQIYFSMDSSGDLPPWLVDSDDSQEVCKSPTDQSFDYLCVRYTGSQAPAVTGAENKDTPVCWVGHCYTSRVVVKKERSGLSIQIRLNNSSVNFPRQMLAPDSAVPCTVEWIPKPLPNRRMESALWDLENANDLAKDIALGRQPADLDFNYNIKEISNKNIPYLSPPNQNQERAILNGLQHRFSLIQGPPGTGKTITGVRLAYLFTELNKQVPLSKETGKVAPQVLYCGPSNKSVDVITEYLMSLGEYRPKIVRVYSSRVEFSEFPVPRKIALSKRSSNQSELVVSKNLKEVALHHMIRQPSCSDSKTICDMDELIQRCPDQVTDEMIEKYMNIITHAEMEIIKHAQVILCTCTASASPKIRHAGHVRQLIIDECGMCMEPEAMIPIVSSRAQQVVLIGDHKQLSPIATQDTARKLGLDQSLFERYSDRAVMLTSQYRMHESICQFPSQHFYTGRLTIGTGDQSRPSALKFWPNGRNKTFVFCHVIGQEETLQVATSDGNEKSKMNANEVQHAVRIAKLLVTRYHIKASDVVVLSQYRAQCASIARGLREQGHTDIAVSTVVKSQGSEWDYVIISTVRSLPKSEVEVNPTNGWRRINLGFITDENQINVAITRARKGLIIIGNKHLLRSDPMWAKLLEYYRNNKKIINADEFMSLK